MAYNHGKEERKWRLWKEAEEKILRAYGVDENIIEEISSGDFVRCSRFYVVNKRHIKSIDYVNRIITITGTKEEIDIGPSMIKSMKSKFSS